MVAVLMISAKLATLGLPEIKIFKKKGYDVLICVHNLTNKILSCDSNNIVDVSWEQSSVTLAFL